MCKRIFFCYEYVLDMVKEKIKLLKDNAVAKTRLERRESCEISD